MVLFGSYFPPAVESFNPSHEFVIICLPPTPFSYWLILKREIELKMTDKIEISDNEMSENLFSYPDDDEVGSEDDSTEDEEGKSLWFFQKNEIWENGNLTVASSFFV